MKKNALLLVLASIFLQIAILAHSQETATKEKLVSAKEKKEVSVGFVVDGGRRSRIAKYLYKDTSKGFARYGKKAFVTLIDVEDADATLFAEYDVVVLVNEKSSKALQPDMEAFAETHVEEENFIVVAFTPRRRNFNTEKYDFDIMTSPSPERSSQPFVINEVSRAILDLL